MVVLISHYCPLKKRSITFCYKGKGKMSLTEYLSMPEEDRVCEYMTENGCVFPKN